MFLNKITEEIVAIVDNLLEYKCISKKQHTQILVKSFTITVIIVFY